jgi:hypothetical protein
MKQELTFQRDFWSSVYEIKDGKQVIGKTERKSVWSYDTNVRIGTTEIFFDVKGIFSNEVDIYDNNKKNLGNIEIDWDYSATINLNGEGIFRFRSNTFLTSEWEILSKNEVLMKFEKDFFLNDGEVIVYQQNDLMLAIGIFLIGFHQQKTNGSS